MGSTGPSAVLLLILNVIHVIFGLVITCASIWFFIEVHSITSLRNTNHYLLDFKVYWPQAIPWVFILVGILVICVSCCGFVSAKKKTSGLVSMYLTFEVLAILALLGGAIVALTLADTNSTDTFVKDTIWDVYKKSETNKAVEIAFGTMEKRFQCCGAGGPRDYKRWKDQFPISCCDTYYQGWNGSYAIDCNLANERHGCTEVAIHYTRVVIRVLSGASIFTVFIAILNVIAAVSLSKSLKKMPRLPMQLESESKKVPL